MHLLHVWIVAAAPMTLHIPSIAGQMNSLKLARSECWVR